ncbi:hypothetical protein E4U43_008126 [Claviceps pusilla]|uniref:WW domain-containing protein n=1 Tax=Claviceps pusilla TaxID=123648 RepID=A0A9P7NDM1_9HYPO|nr:hypothetical protein E4U43_008126 [Claviceps pusilla]
MAGLPPKWEWDYDGRRWFYKYTPTGHVQYHFPSEGDEFPQFVQAGEPAPKLAPEERLESQQQLKRQTMTGGSNDGASVFKKAAPLGMSATARPVSAVWEGDDDDDDAAEEPDEGVFQPENFMFLGPGTYADVSPLNEDEEEAAKRAVAGGMAGKVEKGESPVEKGRTIPTMGMETRIEACPAPSTFGTDASKADPEEAVLKSDGLATNKDNSPAIESLPVGADVDTSPPTVEEGQYSEAVHVLDSREMLLEIPEDATASHRFDPVGIVAEMPTGETGLAHIERYPDPVEIADNSILAPIETMQRTMTAAGFAELPEKSSSAGAAGDGGEKSFCIVKTPTETKTSSTGRARAATEATTLPTLDTEQGAHDATAQKQLPEARQSRLQPSRPRTGSEPSSRRASRREEAHSTAGQQLGGTPPGTSFQTHGPFQSSYQAYMPGQTNTPPVAVSEKYNNNSRRQSMPLQREASLMLKPGRGSGSVDLSTVPKALSPPYEPLKMVQTMGGQSEGVQRRGKDKKEDWGAGLARVPSVLKPGRSRGDSAHEVAPVQQVQKEQQQSQQKQQQKQHQGGQETQTSESAAQQDPSHTRAMYKVPFVLGPAQEASAKQPGLLITGRQTLRSTAQSGQARYDGSPTTEVSAPSGTAQSQTNSSSRQIENAAGPRRQQTVLGTIHHDPIRPAIARPNRSAEFISGSRVQNHHHQQQQQQQQNQDHHQSQQAASASHLRGPLLKTIQDVAADQHRPLAKAASATQLASHAAASPPQQNEQKPPPAASSIFDVPPLRHVHNAAAGQPIKPQSPPSDHYQSAMSRPQPDPLGLIRPDLRRVSAFSPEDSPIRPRTDSQVSSMSQSPADSSRRRSSNALDSSFTPSPPTDSASALGLNHQSAATVDRMSADAPTQSPPVPAKIREHAEGSFFPAQKSPDGRSCKDKPRPEEHPHRQQYQPPAVDFPQSPLQPSQQEQLRPGIPPKVPLPYPSQQQSQPSSESDYPGEHRVKSPRCHSAPAAPANHGNNVTASSSGSGHLLGSIDEREGQGQTSRPGSTPHATRPSSVVSSLRQSISDTPSSPQPQSLTPSQGAGSGRQSSGQPPMAQPTIRKSSFDQNPPDAMSTGQMPSQICPEPLPVGFFPGHPSGQWSPAASQGYPLQGFQGRKDKEKKWTKWFKGSSRKSNAPLQAQMLPPQPGPIPRPIPGTEPHAWTGGPFSPAHIQQPGQQGPTGTGPRGQRQRPSSMSDSASIPTSGDPDDRSRYVHGRPLSPRQAPELLQQNLDPGLGSRIASALPPWRQVLQGQAFQRQDEQRREKIPQMLSEPVSKGHQLCPDQNVSFRQSHSSGNQSGSRQISHAQNTSQSSRAAQRPSRPPPRPLSGQTPPGQAYYGQAHPLSLPLNSPQQGYTKTTQSGFRPQSQSSSVVRGASLQKTPLSQQTQSRSEQLDHMPASLLVDPRGSRSANMQPTERRANQHVAASNTWAQESTMDYSGGDWGGQANWSRG